MIGYYKRLLEWFHMQFQRFHIFTFKIAKSINKIYLLCQHSLLNL